MMRLLTNKKGAIERDQLVGWLIALVFLGVMIAFIVTGGFKKPLNVPNEIVKCQGLGMLNGQCVASASACSGLTVQGLGCEATPATPMCCFSDKKKETAPATAETDCAALLHTTDTKCAGSISKISLPDFQTLVNPRSFNIVCNYTPPKSRCVGAVIKSKDGKILAQCSFLPISDQTPGQGFFDCDLSNTDKFPPADYIADCYVNTNPANPDIGSCPDTGAVHDMPASFTLPQPTTP